MHDEMLTLFDDCITRMLQLRAHLGAARRVHPGERHATVVSAIEVAAHFATEASRTVAPIAPIAPSAPAPASPPFPPIVPESAEPVASVSFSPDVSLPLSSDIPLSVAPPEPAGIVAAGSFGPVPAALSTPSPSAVPPVVTDESTAAPRCSVGRLDAGSGLIPILAPTS